MDPRTWALVFLILSWGGPIGLGIFFLGVGFLWWVSLQAKKAKQE